MRTTAFQITVHGKEKDAVIPAEGGERLLSALQRAGLSVVDAPCGGNGTCGKCRVKVARVGKEEECLACRTAVTEDLEVWPLGGAQPQLAWTEDLALQPDEARWEGNAPALGAAVDIGTTTVAAYLYDLRTGRRLGASGETNGQRMYGADVISRIRYSTEHGTEVLTDTIRRQMDRMVGALCREAGATPEQVKYLAVAGNTVMEHLFAGLSPATIGVAPFRTLSLFGTDYPAAQLGISAAQDALLYLTPAVSGYVGGDITAGILAAGVRSKTERFLFLDIGTNGEMALGDGSGAFLCCATAAGPAFEGAEIAMGMSAEAGAVSAVFLRADGTIGIEVVGGAEPKGICGSGLVDALAVMLDLGAVNEAGRLLPAGLAPPEAAPMIGKNAHGAVFYLTPDRSVFLSEGDVRKLQLAKAAIQAGIGVLLQEAAIAKEKIDVLYLAGGFGNYIRKESAARIGLLPACLLHRVRTLGNAAGAGAVRVLLSSGERDALQEIRNRCRYLELSGNAVFLEEYIEAMAFPPGKR